MRVLGRVIVHISLPVWLNRKLGGTLYLVINETESSRHEASEVGQREHANGNAKYCIDDGDDLSPLCLRSDVSVTYRNGETQIMP